MRNLNTCLSCKQKIKKTDLCFEQCKNAIRERNIGEDCGETIDEQKQNVDVIVQECPSMPFDEFMDTWK